MIPSSHYERGITQNMYFLFSADAHTRRSHPQCHCGNVPPQSDHLKIRRGNPLLSLVINIHPLSMPAA